MASIKRLVLDVLKPHQPNTLELAGAIAELGEDYRVKIVVEEMDDKTESTLVVIEGSDIRFDAVIDAITRLGGSLHSIDEVEVTGG